ncbi:hypothetical protein PIB30_096664 [Stylosanthes scabra]|uniref:Uncharacterized protein n=1 Tax=Stylosanthes scabra TaxID=79078 RepID=A0ABU6UWV4_9FABA|nr:hypothetical protein [Stylosanthes scabra]
MGSGIIYYEYEKHEKFEDYDLKANAELGIFKMRRYHFDDESFVHPLRSVRFDPDRPYEVPIEALMADHPLSSSDKGRTSARGSHRSDGQVQCSITHRGCPSQPVESFRLLLLSGVEPSVEKEEEEDPEEDQEEEEDPEEEVPASTSLPMDINPTKDYLQFIEELERHPENSPIHSDHASVPDLPEDSSDPRSASHGAPSYNISRVWQPPSLGLSL